jgi:nucleoside diphosphate kinase
MKRPFQKLNLLVLCLALLFSGCKKESQEISHFEYIGFPNENELSWDYPTKPGSDAWSTFRSHDEMLEASLIPSTILSKLSTEELFLICLKYPLLMDIGAFNLFTDGYASYETNFNGIWELYQRSNAPSVIYRYYQQLKLQNAVMYSSISFIFRVSVIEYMISATPVITKFSASQRKEVATELLSKLNIKKSQPGDFSGTYLNSTYRALIKVIRCDETGNLSSDDTKLANYFAGIFLPPENVIEQADEIIRQYLK